MDNPNLDTKSIQDIFLGGTAALHRGINSPIYFDINNQNMLKAPSDLLFDISIAIASLTDRHNLHIYTEPRKVLIPTSLVETGYIQTPLFDEEVMKSLLAPNVYRECILWSLETRSKQRFEIAVPLEFFNNQQKYRYLEIPIAIRRASKVPRKDDVINVNGTGNLDTWRENKLVPRNFTMLAASQTKNQTNFVQFNYGIEA